MWWALIWNNGTLLFAVVDEKDCTIYNRGAGVGIVEEDDQVLCEPLITLDTMIKLIRYKSVR